MKVVVDTNVVAYHLLGSESFLEETGSFWRAVEEVLAPSSWEAEIVNVLWMAVRQGVVTTEEAVRKLELTSRLGIESIPVRRLWRGALVKAVQAGLAVYDALFVELAQREGRSLATFDRAVLRAFPEVAKRPGDLTLSPRAQP